MARIVRCAANPSRGLSDFLAAPYPTLIRHRVAFRHTDGDRMTSRTRTPLVVFGLIAALALGLGLGAAAFAVLDDGATTVVRQVTVEGSEPVASDGLSPREIYDRPRRPSSRSRHAADRSRARRDPASCTTATGTS